MGEADQRSERRRGAFFHLGWLHSYEDIPILLGIENTPGDVFGKNPDQSPRPGFYYASSIGTDARFAKIIVEQAEALIGNSARLPANLREG